jgi:K+-transporting ATPase ATPase B chain
MAKDASRTTPRQRGAGPGRRAAPGDRVRVSAGELIPADGEIVEGLATINEAAVTGESAPVLREAGTDRSGVIGGTKVLSDEHRGARSPPSRRQLPRPHDRAGRRRQRQKTPNEIALTMLLAAMTLVFLIVCVTLPAIGLRRRRRSTCCCWSRCWCA